MPGKQGADWHRHHARRDRRLTLVGLFRSRPRDPSPVDQMEMAARVLAQAQETADAAIAEAKAQAEQILAEARREADEIRDAARRESGTAS